MKFLLEAKPKWLFIGLVTLMLGALPFAASSAGVVTNDLAQGDPKPEVVTVQLGPRPHDHATPTIATPTPTIAPVTVVASPPPVTVEQPTIIIEQPDLSAILAAIDAIEANDEPVDIDALAAAIAAAVADLGIIVEVTVDGQTFVCDTRGATCAEPPFGRE